MSIPLTRFFISVLAVLALSACGGHNDRVPLVFNAVLTGQEAVPVNGSVAFATGIVTVDSDRRTMTASLVPTGIVDADVRIHQAVPGRVGPVVVPLAREAGGALWTATVPITFSQLIALREGNYYFVVASPTFPAGEIRGQIIEQFPSPEQLARLHAVRAQSLLAQQQLEQVQEIEDADGWGFTGIGLTIGF